MTRWLVTGADGMLGRDLVIILDRCGETVTGMGRASLDVTDPVSVTGALAAFRPDVVVNCAAWTAVDDAEANEDQARAVNAGGAANLAAACAPGRIRLVQMSTDYVFAGMSGRPYAENDVPAPRSAYGRTKLAGERAVLDYLPDSGYVVRTAWLYGAHGPSFVRTMIRLEQRRQTVDVVDDQYGQPTWTVEVARQVIALVGAAGPGIYHATSSGQTTWCGLAREVFRLLGADPARVRPIPSSALPRPAPRPAYSVLGHSAWTRAGVAAIGDWRCSLRRAFGEIAASAAALTELRLLMRVVTRRGLPVGRRAAQAGPVGSAVRVGRQQPLGAGLPQRRGGGVLLREQWFHAGRPGDADVRVEGVYAVFTFRRVSGRA